MKNWIKPISLILALIATLTLVMMVHSLAKLPDEPLWASPTAIYDNWQFALILGLSIPYPSIFAPLILLLILWINYRIFKFILKKIF